MTDSDENDLRRLTELLRIVDGHLEHGSPQREALKKAGIALGIAFVRGLRSDIDREFAALDAPLTESQLQRLRSMGLNPDTDV